MNRADAKTTLIAVARHPLRVLGRGGAMAALVAAASIDCAFRRRDSLPARAAWASRWLGRVLRIGGVRITVRGPFPAGRMVVANHSGYLDIAVLAALRPVVFVAKHDLRDAPIFGRLARHAGTIFIDRRRKRDLLAVIAALPNVVNAGALPAFFPEGGTSDSAQLLPFRSSLFAPAVTHGWSIAPVHIRYALEGGEGCVAREICWWGGMTFFPHFIALLAKRCVHARVTFGEAVPPGPDRKALARELQRRVERLGQARRELPAPSPARHRRESVAPSLYP